LGLPTGLLVSGFNLYIFFTTLVSGILFMCPNQLNLCALTQFIMFRWFVSSSNSLLVLILQLTFFSLVGPNIVLSIFLSSTKSLYIILSLRTHASQPLIICRLLLDFGKKNCAFLYLVIYKLLHNYL
jgi:hypothetical protein